MNYFEQVMSQFPLSSTNNARAIVKSKLERMSKSPNDRNAQELDALGFSVDHDDRADRAGEWQESDFSNNK